jgi:hypothetical protein
MRREITATTHFFASLAITAAAVGTAFALPVDARAEGVAVQAGGDDASAASRGKSTSVQRPLAPFSKLHVDGSIDVDAHPGPHPGATVHADAQLEPLIETVVEGDTLVVRMKRGVHVFSFGRENTRVEVEFSQLTATRQSGSGDLHVSGLNAANFESAIHGSGDLKMDNAQLGNFALRIEGSGDVRIAGKADDAKFSIAGSGDISAQEFVARRVAVDIRGSGDARVNATDALDAHVAGSGDVTYRGHPHDISRNVMGSGSVTAAD